LFVHCPVDAVRVEPARAVPEIDGWLVLAGRWSCAAISAVAFDAAVVLPLAFVAVTRTRSLEPTSLDETTYACVLAPLITAQSEPSGLPPELAHRTH
jgi:hypothetical protein